MSGKSKRKNKPRLLLKELPPEIRGAIEKAIQETINDVLTIATIKKTKMRIEEQKAKREELERILMDLIDIDPQELSEHLSEEEFLASLISTLYYIKKVAASRPTNIDSKLLMYYFRTIDAIATSLARMIKNTKEMIAEKTIQINQTIMFRENPTKELERLETILTMLEGLKKHIKNIIEMDM